MMAAATVMPAATMAAGVNKDEVLYKYWFAEAVNMLASQEQRTDFLR
jgi:hypothetical protein